MQASDTPTPEAVSPTPSSSSSLRWPTYFISHGGGPWPWVPRMRALHADLEAALKAMAAELGHGPRAILVVSGHWEQPQYTVMASPKPSMLYDYNGFPPRTYTIAYDAPGAPDALAQRTADLLTAAGLPARLDTERGFDHGTFVPLAVMYPDADVPVYQLSLRRGYDAAEHVAVGRALAPLRDEGVVIVGSGLSYHNLRNFGAQAQEPSAAFDSWLFDTLCRRDGGGGGDDGNDSVDTYAARTRAIVDWEREAPHARTCHPEEDHFAPLFIALGAAEREEAHRTYEDHNVMGVGVWASSYRFGSLPDRE